MPHAPPDDRANDLIDDANQVVIPLSFIALFVPPGRAKPAATRTHIAERYEFCEDLAQMLGETTASQRWSLGITTADALERVQRGLQAMDADLNTAERQWVFTRLAELLPPFDG
jgi:hypothetical protein